MEHAPPGEARRRSAWGWGWRDRWPDAEARRDLGVAVSAMLGFPVQEPEEPLPEEAWRLPSPRVQPPAEIAGFSSNDRYLRALHTWGRTAVEVLRGMRGDFSRAPDFVVRPRSESELAAVLEAAGRGRLAVVPWGGGTSVVGGVSPDPRMIEEGRWNGWLSLDLGGMAAVAEIDPLSRAARIQAGARGPELNAALHPHGLELRHFPQSWEFASIGGGVATRAGGHYATGPTHIDDLVESVRMLGPRGAWESRRLPASGAGPAPDRWLLGSEGTLGVIVECWLRVQARPRYRASASGRFRDWNAAVRGTRAVVQSGLQPANCRLLDAREAALSGAARGGEHVLLLGFESATEPQRPWMEAALRRLREDGGDVEIGEPRYRDGDEGAAREWAHGAGSPDASAAWRDTFLEAPYLRDRLLSLGILADTFETACTWDRFADLHDAIVRDVRATLKRVCGAGRLACRFTHVYPDGPAPYYTWLAPARRGGEEEQWAEVKRAAEDAIVRAGGTITHHHAVGRLHAGAWAQERPPLFFEALRAAKSALDPLGMLNPGVLGLP
jgi:alkyldihydroxyacetonephosphate synthase